MKSGYRQWHLNYVGNEQSDGWSRLWKLDVPPKVKILMWRVCRNNVPIRILLRGKGVQVPISCAMCVREVENVCHLFFECSFIKECWQFLGVSYDMSDVAYISDWVLSKLCTESTLSWFK